MPPQPELLFVGDRFPFPIDCGAKIRTTQILRGLRGGRFRTRLLCPATEAQKSTYRAALAGLADEVTHWPVRERGPLFKFSRLAYLASSLPVAVRSDYSPAGAQLVAAELEKRPQVAVIDFVHSCVLAPGRLPVPSVLFTHNVEAEIFRRHMQVASNPARRWVWRNQWLKMDRFERRSLQRFDAVVAVSERDRACFESEYGIRNVRVIPTGVDLEQFPFAPSPDSREVNFLGSMDWMANIEAMEFFAAEVWPLLRTAVPGARMRVIGRNPPANLVQRVAAFGSDWSFTGYVDDVRPHVQAGAATVIPLRVGGGTRLKVFEAMAMGCPMVSTAIGVEGLPVEGGRHYLEANTAEEMAKALTKLLLDRPFATTLARNGRQLAEQRGSSRFAANVFEEICASVSS